MARHHRQAGQHATVEAFDQGFRRALAIAAVLSIAFLAVSAQLVRLAMIGQGQARLQTSEPVVRSYTRPDIVDRRGRLIATDLSAFSLYADPVLVLDADEAAEKISDVLPELDAAELRRLFAEKSKRFVWVKRALPPATAQRIHDLGLPGLMFRTEPKRTYPQGRVAGHVLGSVAVDNRAQSGVERFIDQALGLESGLSGELVRPPAVLTLDLGVQHSLEQELRVAMAEYKATGAAGVLLDVDNGEVLAVASLPSVDPGRPTEALEPNRIDRVNVASYELGSVFKALTIAMALDDTQVTPDTLLDVRVPLQVGRFTIADLHPAGRPLTVREVFILSSNVGAGMLAQRAGAERMRSFLKAFGIGEPMRTEAGAVTTARLPARWGAAELVTVAYGHGLTITPMQFAAAGATLVNGGYKVEPRLIRSLPGVPLPPSARERILKPETSAMLRDMMRRNVIQPNGTGRRSEVPGLEVGGKTGTAEMAGKHGYREKSVVASFLAAFPMSAPRYVLLVTLIEPQAAEGTKGQITAGVNAAPVAGRVIARTGGLLGVEKR